MRAKNGAWEGSVRGHKVRWSKAGGWKVDGRKLPERGGYDQRDWETAVIAWQQAVYQSFKQLNREVEKHMKQKTH